MFADGINHLLDLQGWQGALLLGAFVEQEALSHSKVEAENRQTRLRVAVKAEVIMTLVSNFSR